MFEYSQGFLEVWVLQSLTGCTFLLRTEKCLMLTVEPHLCLNHHWRRLHSAPLVGLRNQPVLQIKNGPELLCLILVVLQRTISLPLLYPYLFFFIYIYFCQLKLMTSKVNIFSILLWQLVGTVGHFWRHCSSRIPFLQCQKASSVEEKIFFRVVRTQEHAEHK